LNSLYFLNKHCKSDQHIKCEAVWTGFGFEIFVSVNVMKKKIMPQTFLEVRILLFPEKTLEFTKGDE